MVLWITAWVWFSQSTEVVAADGVEFRLIRESEQQ